MEISLLVGLATELAKAYNMHKSSSRPDRIAALERDLQHELSLGQLADDFEIERLDKEIRIECRALYNEVLLANAKK